LNPGTLSHQYIVGCITVLTPTSQAVQVVATLSGVLGDLNVV